MDITLDIRCVECANILDVTQKNPGLLQDTDVNLRITPCETCLEKARAESYKEGKEVGHEEGFDAGRNSVERD